MSPFAIITIVGTKTGGDHPRGRQKMFYNKFLEITAKVSLTHQIKIGQVQTDCFVIRS